MNKKILIDKNQDFSICIPKINILDECLPLTATSSKTSVFELKY